MVILAQYNELWEVSWIRCNVHNHSQSTRWRNIWLVTCFEAQNVVGFTCIVSKQYNSKPLHTSYMFLYNRICINNFHHLCFSLPDLSTRITLSLFFLTLTASDASEASTLPKYHLLVSFFRSICWD